MKPTTIIRINTKPIFFTPHAPITDQSGAYETRHARRMNLVNRHTSTADQSFPQGSPSLHVRDPTDSPQTRQASWRIRSTRSPSLLAMLSVSPAIFASASPRLHLLFAIGEDRGEWTLQPFAS